MREHGTAIITGENGTVTMKTLQCCHCAKHWHVRPGSGRHRGFCMKCMSPTCGAEACEKECVHWRKRMELAERGR